jgi:hypothetical protein
VKTVYISARAKTQLENVRDIQQKIANLGYQIVSDWTSAIVKRPYRDLANRQQNIEVQTKMLERAARADIFVLLDEPGLRGAYVELGAFLTDCLNNSKGRRAYIVGPDSHEREFIFESPNYIVFADTIEEVYKDLKS